MTHPMSEQGQAISERLERDREYAAMSWIDEAADELDRLHARIAELEGYNEEHQSLTGMYEMRIKQLEAENKQLSLEAYRGKEGGYDDE